MAQDTKTLRLRIKSVTSTLHLTKAMELVASSKVNRAMTAMLKSREYSTALEDIVAALSRSPECEKSPYMQKRDGGKTAIVVIAGDRGLAGGYNANVFRLSAKYPDAEFIPIGKRACERYSCDNLSSEKISSDEIMAMALRLCRDFEEGKYGSVCIISTEYVSMMTQTAVINEILPLKKPKDDKRISTVFEPGESEVLAAAVPEYVAGKITAALRESFASEVAARRMAMDSAQKNAQTMIDDLTLEYNRARQGAITQEITEIVAGSGR